MDSPTGTPEGRYAVLVEQLGGHPRVTYAGDSGAGRRAFGSSALKIDNKIFAMISQGGLVVKLPRHRVDELINAGAGVRFDPGHGRLMKEWLAVAGNYDQDWLPLAAEAMEFVGGRR